VGNVWETVGDYAEEFESGFGIGARVKTPLGPMRLDLGFPLTKVKDEKQKPRFHFNISRGF
jgi:outer membrane translocation and assembly module TamA